MGCPCDFFWQLLNLVVRKERPDLADLGEQLVEQQNGFKIKMKELEDNILYKLATAEGVVNKSLGRWSHDALDASILYFVLGALLDTQHASIC